VPLPFAWSRVQCVPVIQAAGLVSESTPGAVQGSGAEGEEEVEVCNHHFCRLLAMRGQTVIRSPEHLRTLGLNATRKTEPVIRGRDCRRPHALPGSRQCTHMTSISRQVRNPQMGH
jgi:hypothetical protein